MSSYVFPDGLTAYADPNDLQDIALTEQFFTGDLSPTSNAVIKALVNASAYIDSFLAANPAITLPLQPPYDPMLVQCCASIAAWNLVAHRGYDPNSTDESLRTLKTDADKWLAKLQEGRVVLKRQVTAPQPLGMQPRVISNADRGLRNRSGRVGGFGW